VDSLLICMWACLFCQFPPTPPVVCMRSCLFCQSIPVNQRTEQQELLMMYDNFLFTSCILLHVKTVLRGEGKQYYWPAGVELIFCWMMTRCSFYLFLSTKQHEITTGTSAVCENLLHTACKILMHVKVASGGSTLDTSHAGFIY